VTVPPAAWLKSRPSSIANTSTWWNTGEWVASTASPPEDPAREATIRTGWGRASFKVAI